MSIHFETARCIVYQHQSETFDSRDRRPKEDNIAIGKMPGHKGGAHHEDWNAISKMQ